MKLVLGVQANRPEDRGRLERMGVYGCVLPVTRSLVVYLLSLQDQVIEAQGKQRVIEVHYHSEDEFAPVYVKADSRIAGAPTIMCRGSQVGHELRVGMPAFVLDENLPSLKGLEVAVESDITRLVVNEVGFRWQAWLDGTNVEIWTDPLGGRPFDLLAAHFGLKSPDEV